MQKEIKVETKFVILYRERSRPPLFLRKGGAVSSLVTADCLFNREEAWHELWSHEDDLTKFEVLYTREVGNSTHLIGLSPDEVLNGKIGAWLGKPQKRKIEKKEVTKNEKKKKTSAEIEPSGLLSFMG